MHFVIVCCDFLYAFFEVTSRALILLLINPHFIEELLEDLALVNIEGLVLIRVHAQTLSSFLTFLALFGWHVDYLRSK